MSVGFASRAGAAGAEKTVANSDALERAVANAVGGDRIRIAPGRYRALRVDQRAFKVPVQILGAGQAKTILEGLYVTRSEGLHVAGLAVARPIKADDPSWVEVSTISHSSRVKFTDMLIAGGKSSASARTGYGLSVRDSVSIDISSVRFRNLHKGVMLIRTNDSMIRSSSFVDLREDGINTAAVSNVDIDGNIFARFHPEKGDHPDAIQMYNSNQTRGHVKVRVRNNMIVQLAGTGTQGIWIADPGAYGFSDILIENNYIQSDDMWNGIGLFGVRGAIVVNNTLVSDMGDDKKLWVRVKGSTGIRLENNVYEQAIIDNPASVTLSNNLDLSRAGARRGRYTKGMVITDRSFDYSGHGFNPAASGVPSLNEIDN